MAGKLNTVTIKHPNHRDDTVVIGDDEKQRYKIVGNQVIGYDYNWGDTVELNFIYTLQPGDVAFLGKSTDDDELCGLIFDLEKEDLDKIRNFMAASGMIK